MAEKIITGDTLKVWTNRHLITEAKSLHESIYVIECYGTKDMLLLELVYRELERRGYEVVEKKRMWLKITEKK